MIKTKGKMPIRQLIVPVAAVIFSASLVSGSAAAETRVETVVGTVVDR